MIEKRHEHEKNLGSLIDLCQIKDGSQLKRIIRDFDKLDSNVKHQINVAFKQKFDELSDKYENIENILNGDLEILGKSYETELEHLNQRIDNHEEYSEKTYMKKTDLIGIDNLSEELKEKIYWLLLNAGDKSDYTTDYNGNLRKIKWSMYIVLFADKILYLKDVKNKSASSEKTISWEDWYGENYELNDFSSNCVELWIYDRPAESYLPLFYLPVTNDFNSDLDYYYITNGVYTLWNKENYDYSTWKVDRENLYYFDETYYQNELINILEKNNFSKTYVFRNLGDYSDKARPDDTDRKEPVCGKVLYNAEASRFTFDNVARTRYIFKLNKYEY